jgi:hypothetical protein
MQLRLKLEHWPPQWGGACARGARFPQGEDAGILVDVRRERNIGFDPAYGEEILVLEVEYEERRWTGVLPIRDRHLRDRVHDLLRENLGRPVSHIGELELQDATSDSEGEEGGSA